MKRILVCLITILLLASCAALPIDKVQVGMTRVEVEELFEEKPISYMKYGTVEVIDYARDYLCTLYFLDGKLREWSCKDSWAGTGMSFGVAIPMPAPARY